MTIEGSIDQEGKVNGKSMDEYYDDAQNMYEDISQKGLVKCN